MQVEFCFYRQAVKAKTGGWNEQKNHSVHCYAAKSLPLPKSVALGEESEDSDAYSDLKSLELSQPGQVLAQKQKKKLLLRSSV